MSCGSLRTRGRASEIEPRIWQKANKTEGTQARYRLSLRSRDRDFFAENVQEPGALSDFLKKDAAQLESDMRRRIQENAAYLRGKLTEMEPTERDDLVAFIVQRCFLVVVEASDRASAYRIFAVMNDRGLDLSPTDILKADIIGAMPEDATHKITGTRLPDFYTVKWETIEEELGRDEFRDLFGHIRTIYAKDKARGALNKEFREAVLKYVDGRQFIDEVLEPLADAYVAVSRAAYVTEHDARDVNAHLKHLNRLDNADWVPPALRFFERHKSDHEALAQFVRDLERLAYVMFVTRRDVNERIRRYAEVTSAIEVGNNLFAAGSPLQLRGDEGRQARAAIDGPVYENTRIRMPLMLRLDSLVADEGAIYDHSVLSLEHVLPQNPEADSEWIAAFPNEEERSEWTHRLANLVLLSRRKNTQAYNYDFDRKKQEYFQRNGTAPFALTAQVLHAPEWTPKVMADRQGLLVDALAKEWRLNDVDSNHSSLSARASE